MATKPAPARYRTQMVTLFFLVVGGVAVVVGLVLVEVSRPIKPLMAGVH